MDYCTLTDIQSELHIPEGEYDDMLQGMIEQAKEFIDKFCHRQFDTVSEARYFNGAKSILFISDLISIDDEGFKLDSSADGTFGKTLATTDYVLYPLNGNPKTYIELSSYPSITDFAKGIKRGVQITGTWGYDTRIPKPIVRASIIQVCRWFKRKDSAFSDVVGTTEMGEIVMYKGLDPDVKLLIEPFIKRTL